MNEEELKALVREAVSRHLAGPAGNVRAGAEHAGIIAHASFHRYALPRGSDTDGPCLIEPSVRCNHCGYCQSHGY